MTATTKPLVKNTVATMVPIDSVGLRGRVGVSPAGLERASVAPTTETHYKSATFMTAITNPLVKVTVTTIVPIDSVGLRGRVGVSPAGLERASVAPTIDTVAETPYIRIRVGHLSIYSTQRRRLLGLAKM